MTGYLPDLACIHDAGFGDFARRTAPELLKILARAGIDQGLVVDLGCGSGIWAAELLRAGYRVLGIDLSESMIEMAKRRAPRAEFRCQSLFEAPIPSCRAVTALGECVCYLFDEKAGSDALLRLCRRVAGALQSGGLFVFDFVEPGGLGDGVRRSFVQGSGWTVLVEAEENVRGRELTRRITTFRKTGELYRRSDEVHRLRTYAATELAARLREMGLKVRIVKGYGEYRFRQGMAGVIARKV